MFGQRLDEMKNGWESSDSKQSIGLLTLYAIQERNIQSFWQNENQRQRTDISKRIKLRSSEKLQFYPTQTAQPNTEQAENALYDQGFLRVRGKILSPALKNKLKLKYSIKNLSGNHNPQPKQQNKSMNEVNKDENSPFRYPRISPVKEQTQKNIFSTIAGDKFNTFKQELETIVYGRKRSSVLKYKNLYTFKPQRFLTLNSQTMENSIESQYKPKSLNQSPIVQREGKKERRINVYNFGNINFENQERQVQERAEYIQRNISPLRMMSERKEMLTRGIQNKPIESLKMKSKRKKTLSNHIFPLSIQDEQDFIMNNDRKLKQILKVYFNKPNKKSSTKITIKQYIQKT